MNKCPVSGCGIFHERMMNCKVARNQLAAGSLPEPYLTANRLELLVEKKAAMVDAEQPAIAPKKVVRQPPIVKVEQEVLDVVENKWDGTERRAKQPCLVCDAKKAAEREYMRKYRAKK